jgi:predicted PurR-regulated permease PerM
VTLNLARTAYTLLIVGIVILLLQFMQPVLIPLVLAALLFYALDPSVDWFERHHLPRAIGAALMMLIVLSACGALAYSLQNQAMTLVDELPEGARKLAASVRRTPGAAPDALEKVQQAADALQTADKPVPAPKGVLRVRVERKDFALARSYGRARSA